jgi:tRNA-dihydrouridine synthase B
LKVLRDSELDFLIVHGRHWTEHYDIPCRYDSIAFFAQNLKIPVIGNGDVACLTSLEKMLATGCAAVMIARAGVGQPWLIKKLTAQINQEIFITPSLPEIGAVFIEHVLRLKDLLEDERFAILQARKFAKYYARPLATRAEFSMAVNECENLKNLERLTSRYFNGSS